MKSFDLYAGKSHTDMKCYVCTITTITTVLRKGMCIHFPVEDSNSFPCMLNFVVDSQPFFCPWANQAILVDRLFRNFLRNVTKEGFFFA